MLLLERSRSQTTVPVLIRKQIEKLLRPFGTGKLGKANQIGEKGVGLKFVIFTSSHFRLETAGEHGACTASIEGASAWVNAASEIPLILELDPLPPPAERFTRVELTIADGNHPLFNYSFNELFFLLRTKTALGDTGHLWK